LIYFASFYLIYFASFYFLQIYKSLIMFDCFIFFYLFLHLMYILSISLSMLAFYHSRTWFFFLVLFLVNTSFLVISWPITPLLLAMSSIYDGDLNVHFHIGVSLFAKEEIPIMFLFDYINNRWWWYWWSLFNDMTSSLFNEELMQQY